MNNFYIVISEEPFNEPRPTIFALRCIYRSSFDQRSSFIFRQGIVPANSLVVIPFRSKFNFLYDEKARTNFVKPADTHVLPVR